MVSVALRWIGPLIGVLMLSASSMAQTGSSEPDSTSARFGAWTINCAGAAASRRCEVSFVETDRQQQPVAIVALGRVSKAAPLKIALRLPVNVQVSAPAKLTVDAATAITLPFRMCVPMGCFAEFEVADETVLIKRLRAVGQDKAGRAEWLDANGNTVGFELPYKGLSSALDGLQREMK